MNSLKLTVAACLSLLLLSMAVNAQQISGDYIETRNADIWTGACVANGELNLAGDQAILAWHVSKGEWNGVALDGLGGSALSKRLLRWATSSIILIRPRP